MTLLTRAAGISGAVVAATALVLTVPGTAYIGGCGCTGKTDS